jgi:hypothetical protein
MSKFTISEKYEFCDYTYLYNPIRNAELKLTFHYDDDISFILEQHAQLDFYFTALRLTEASVH